MHWSLISASKFGIAQVAVLKMSIFLICFVHNTLVIVNLVTSSSLPIIAIFLIHDQAFFSTVYTCTHVAFVYGS